MPATPEEDDDAALEDAVAAELAGALLDGSADDEDSGEPLESRVEEEDGAAEVPVPEEDTTAEDAALALDPLPPRDEDTVVEELELAGRLLLDARDEEAAITDDARELAAPDELEDPEDPEDPSPPVGPQPATTTTPTAHSQC